MDTTKRHIDALIARDDPAAKAHLIAWKRRMGILLNTPHDICFDCAVGTMGSMHPESLAVFKADWQKLLWFGENPDKIRENPDKIRDLVPRLQNWIQSSHLCDLCGAGWAASVYDIREGGYWGRGVEGQDRGEPDWREYGCVMAHVTPLEGSVRGIEPIRFDPYDRPTRHTFSFICRSVEYPDRELKCSMPCVDWSGVVGWVEPTEDAHPFSVKDLGHYDILQLWAVAAPSLPQLLWGEHL